MSVLKAIGRALAAMSIMVAVWSVELGKFVMKCRPGHVPADTDDLVDQYTAVAKNEAAADLTAPRASDQTAQIQMIADCLFCGHPIEENLLVDVSNSTLKWLGALNAEMLVAVSMSKPEVLRSHLRGEKAIRGLLAFDAESVAAYRQAMEAPTSPEPKPEPTRSSRRRSEPLLPAFGPIC